jgi:hypothetical protein
MAKQFTRVEMYGELALTVLRYEDRQEELLDNLGEVKSRGIPTYPWGQKLVRYWGGGLQSDSWSALGGHLEPGRCAPASSFPCASVTRQVCCRLSQKFDSSGVRPGKQGRPEIPPHISKLILRFARENRRCGVRQLRDRGAQACV